MTRTSRAWLMEVAAGWQVAVGASHVLEYAVASEAIAVPRASRHCAGLLLWRERLIPVIDFALLLAERERAHSQARPAAIIAYQERPAQPLRYGALVISRAPVEVWVGDDMAGSLTDIPEAFAHLSRACFVHDRLTVPILDPRQLFTRPLPNETERPSAVFSNPDQTAPDVVIANFPVFGFPDFKKNREQDTRTE